MTKKLIQNGNNIWTHAFNMAGIPNQYHNTKYSNLVKNLNENKRNGIKNFLNSKVKGIFFTVKDHTIPYVLFRRMMVINRWLCESKVVSSYDIQNKSVNVMGERLNGIFRIDVNNNLNKSILTEYILQAFNSNSRIILTSTYNGKDVKNYFSSIWDLFDDNNFERINIQ